MVTGGFFVLLGLWHVTAVTPTILAYYMSTEVALIVRPAFLLIPLCCGAMMMCRRAGNGTRGLLITWLAAGGALRAYLPSNAQCGCLPAWLEQVVSPGVVAVLLVAVLVAESWWTSNARPLRNVLGVSGWAAAGICVGVFIANIREDADMAARVEWIVGNQDVGNMYIENKGEQEVRITEVRALCDCLEIIEAPKVITGNGIGQVVIRLRYHPTGGPQVRPVLICGSRVGAFFSLLVNVDVGVRQETASRDP